MTRCTSSILVLKSIRTFLATILLLGQLFALAFPSKADSSGFYDVFEDFYDLPEEEQTIENFVQMVMDHPSEPQWVLRMSECYIGHGLFKGEFDHDSETYEWLDKIDGNQIQLPSVKRHQTTEYGQIVAALKASPTVDDLQLSLGSMRYPPCSVDE